MATRYFLLPMQNTLVPQTGYTSKTASNRTLDQRVGCNALLGGTTRPLISPSSREPNGAPPQADLNAPMSLLLLRSS